MRIAQMAGVFEVLKYVNIIIMMALAIFAGCNNPSGGSSIARDHSPGLQPPGAFSFTQIRAQNSSATLRWSPSPRVATYKVFQGTDASDITTPLSCSSTQTYCTVTGLNPATLYYYKVVATNAAGSKSTAVDKSLAVGSFNITSNTPSDKTITLSWDNATGATSYNIIYGTISGSYTSSVSNVTSPYALTNLSNNRNYFVRVVAVNANNGYGLSDNEITDKPFGPPPTPTGVSALASPGQITLTWGTSSGAVHYNIYRGTTSGSLGLHVSGHTTTNYVDNTVSDGTEYFYAIEAVTPPYSSAQSAEVSAKPISNFNVTSANSGPGANQITVTWPAVTGADTFDIRYGTSPTNLNLTATGVTSPHALTGLTGSVTYYIRVRANNAAGVGTSLLSQNQLNAIPVPLLAAPGGFTATAIPGQVTLNWNAVSGSSNYEVLRGTTSGSYTTLASGITGTSYVDSTVSNGTSYYYVVRGFNGINGTLSVERAVKPIESFSISSVTPVSSSSLQVSWSAGAGADLYDVQYGTVSGTYSNTISSVTSPYSITGLSANTTYYIVVRGRNTVGSGTNYITAQSSGLTETAAPSGLTATSTPGSVALDWTNTPGATSYNVYRGTTSGSHALLASGLGSSDYVDNSVSNGTTYFYVVTASNGSESANSSEVSTRPIDNFTLTSVTAASPTSVTVTWPAATGAATYDIRYGTSTGSYTTTLTNRTSPATITGLAGNTTYYVIVVAKNAVGAGTSRNSDELSVTTPVGPPTGLTATVGTGQITLNWTAMSGASSYKIYRSTTSGSYGAPLATGVVGTSYVDSTVSDGTQYYYVLKSFNGSDSADSAEVTGKSITPFALTSVVALSTTSLQVTFPSTAGGDLYDVRYGTTSGSYTVTQSGVTSPRTITGLVSNTTYYVVARARNTVGTGASQQTAEISIKTPVAAPGSLAATSTPGQVALTWGAVSGATTYNVYRGTTSGSTTLFQSGVATNSFTDTTVSNGTTYYYAVTSDNGSESAKSSEVATQPIAAHTISSVTSPSSTSIQVTWGAVTGATAYDVRWGTTSGTYTGLASNQSSPYTITGLSANTTYYIVVRAKNTVGTGTNVHSTEVSLKTATVTPTGLLASASSGQVGLNWNATTGATSYNVYRGTTSGSLTLLASGVGSNAYLDTTVANGTTYFYTVSADNGSESAQSAEVSVRPIASFSLTSVVAASSTSITVTWPATAGAATYDVRYGTSPGVYLWTVTGVTSPYTITGLSPNTLYYVAVRANNSVGAGTNLHSNELNATTATAAPTTLVATSSASGTASLTWTASTGATNYRIYRGTTSGSYSQIASGVTGTTYSDTTVSDGTTYFYAVRAFNGTESPNSNESSVQSIADFSISGTTAPTPNSIQVTWPAATGATLYDVRYGTTSGSYTTISSVTSPYTITGLASGTDYFVVVRARNAIGGTASNQTPEVSQITPIGPPSGVAASATPGSVTVTWTAAGGASSYKIYRSTTSGSYGAPLATGIGTTSYVDNTVSNGTTYFYVVKSFNGADSANSNEATVRPIAPVSISSLTSPSSTSLQVSWGAVAGAANYDVRYGTSSGSYTTTLSGQSSPTTITGLTPNTTYYVVVRANNSVGAGTSETSSESSLKTATAAPVGLVASATPGQVGLNWSAVTGATTYNVYRGTTSGSLALLSGGVAGTAYLDTTVANGTTYFYAVSADNGSESAQSSEVSVRPIASFSITSLTAQSSTSLNVSWGAAAGAATYDVRYGTSSGVYLTTVTGVTSPYNLTGLTANTQYFVVVRANNSVGAGTQHTTSEMNVTTATAAPTSLVATATTSQIDLSWVAASGATNYRIYRGTSSGSYSQIAAGVTGTTYSDTTAVNGTQYYYVARSFNGIESVDSNEVTGKAIANFSISSTTAPSTTTIQVTWTNPAGGDLADVRFGTASGSYTTTASAVSSPYTITGLTANTNYYIVVRARNTVGNGNSLQTAEVIQKTPTAAPSGLAATATPGSVSLTWNATGGATSYNVYRGTSSGSYSSLATGVGTNSYTDATAANGTTYYYVVTAVNGAESAYSNEVFIRPIASFAITSATPQSPTEIQVTWPAVTGADAYDIKYGTSSGSYTTTLSNETSPKTITGLSTGSTYYIVVVARNSIGSTASYQSAEVSTTTAFGAPSGLIATATPGNVSLSWGSVSGATQYKVYRGLTPGSYSLLDGNVATNSYNDATVANGTSYYYAVTAFNGADSPYSNEAAVRPISTFTLSSVTATSSSTIDLSWTAATGAASYDVRYGTSTGSYTTTLTNQVSPLTVTGLSANTTYYFQVQAKNTVGSGTTVSSSELSAKTATAAPGSLVATATTSQISLTWASVTGATNYNVYRSTTSGSYGAALATGVATTSYNDATAVNGTTYYYVVKANNGIESAASSEVAGQPISSFSISSTTTPSTTSIQVSWPNTTGATAYDVRYGTSTGSYTTTVSGVTSPYTITGLSSATTYYIVVRARNTVGSGANVQTPEVSQITPLSAPSGLAATSTPGNVSLTWTAVPGATSYKVYRSTTSGSYGAALATGVGTNSYSDNTVANGTTYFYVVKAFNGADSADSNEATTRPMANFSITSTSSPSSSSIDVTWTGPTGSSTFDVRYGTATGSYSTTLTGVTSPYTITGLAANTNYFIVVRANNAIGSGTSVTSSESVQKTATAAPTGLAAVATPGSVSLTWNAVAGATDYKIFRGTTSGSLSLLASGNVPASYTDNTVANGTTYFYAIVSNNGSDSAQSSEVSIRPISTFTFSSATVASATSLDLTWTAATGAATYDVQYGTSSGSYTSSVTGVTSPYTLTGLTANTTYYVRIQAKNAIGSGTTVNSSELSAKTATTAPTGLVASSSAAGQISLTWTGVTGATSYNVYRSTTSGSYGAALATGVATTTYSDSTVTDGTTYFYVVRANNGALSANSNESSAQSIANFTISGTTAPTSTTIQVSWPNTTGATAYDVRYGTSTGSYTTTISGVTSPHTITGLTSAATYYIVVRARNTVGGGANTQTPEVSQITPVGAPTGLAAVASAGNIALTWNAVAGATSYKVYRSTTSGSYGAALATGIGTTSYNDNTIVDGTQYYYVVRAFNGADSVNSSEVTARSIANFSITLTHLSATSIQVSWTNPAGGSTYDVRYGTATGSYGTTISGQTSPYTITGLSSNTTYFVVVRANNSIGSGTSTTSAESSLKTATGAPTGLVATGSPGSVGLTWTAVTGATSYKVFRGTTSGSLSLLASGVGTNSYTDNTVANGTTYFYAVVATNGNDSAQSSEVSVRPISTFSLTAATPASSTSIDLTWGNATGAASYTVRYGTTSGVYLWTVPGVTSSYTLTGLSPNTRYYISIRATNAVGAGTTVDSNELNALTATGVPTGLAATATPGNVNLTWTTVSGATSYNIYRGTTSGSYSQIASGVGTNSYNDNTVANGTTYYYMVRAFNGLESGNSSEVAVKPIASFTLAAAVVDSSSAITLTWGAAAGADAYDVKYGTSTGTYTVTVSGVTSSYQVTGLSAATMYFFAISARNAVGAGTTRLSNEVSGRTATAAPGSLVATSTNGNVALTWSAASGATNYNVYRGTSSGVYSLLQSAVATTSFNDNTIVNGTTYYYVVRSFNGTESANSNEAAIATIGSFSITGTTPTSNTIQVTWGAAANATAYDVRYGTSSGSYSTTVTGVTSPYTITGLSSNTTYFILVRARNAGSTTIFNSAEVSQITTLAAPSGLVATGGTSQVSLTWNAVAGASSYKVYRGTTSGSLTLLASGIVPTSYSDNTALNGTTYFYAVSTFNGADSPLSSEVSKRPIAVPVISSVIGNSDTTIQVNWGATTGADTFDLQWGTTSGTYPNTIAGVTSPTSIPGLTAGTTYFVRIVAKNAIGGGTSINSAQSSGTPNSPPVVSFIANQTMEGDTSLPVNFTLSDSNHVLTCAGSMSMSSTNTTLLPNTNVVFSGTLPNCTGTITPAAGQTGTTTVTFTATDGISNTSRVFDLTVTPCTVASIVWETQPVGMAAGSLFGTAPRVSLRKANNSLCTSNSAPVSLVVTTDTTEQQDAAITGIASVVPSGGYAHFTGARMERAGTGFTVIASQDGITSVDSNTFNVTAGAASRLVFYQQPLTNDPSSTLIPGPSVRTADAFGNYVAVASVNVTMSLQNNLTGATLSGTLTVPTNASGIAAFTNLSINNLGTYFLRATPGNGWSAVDSEFFDIITITPQNFTSVIEMTTASITGTNGNATHDRTWTQMGTNFHDGLNTCTWKFIGYNTGNQTADVFLRLGTGDIATQSIPKTVTVPTTYMITFPCANFTASGNWNLRTFKNAVIVSSQIILRQVGAKRTQAFIPLISIEENSPTESISTASTTPIAINGLNFPTYSWVTSEWSNLNQVVLTVSGKTTSGSFCGALFNKSTETQIGAEVCSTSTADTVIYQNIPKNLMPSSGELEVRVRNTTGGTATIYKAGLYVRMVNIVKAKSIQRAAPAQAGLTASTSMVATRHRSYLSDFGTAVKTEKLECRAKGGAGTSGSFAMRDAGTNTSGTTTTATVSGSTINYSTQSSFTSFENTIGPTTNTRYYLINYTHTSGSIDLSQCLYSTNASY